MSARQERFTLFLLKAVPVAALVFMSLLLTFLYYDYGQDEHIFYMGALRTEHVERQKQTIKAETERAIQTIYELRQLLQTRGVDEAQIRADVLRQIEKIRFGKNGYFFIYDYQGVNLMHPIKPHLVGKNLFDLQDGDGVYVIRDLIDSARAQGQYVNYIWHKPDINRPANKIGYALGVEDWQWMVGTGVYIDDIDQVIEVREMALDANQRRTMPYVIGTVVAVILVTALLLFFLIRKISNELVGYKELEQLYLMLADKEEQYRVVFESSAEAIMTLGPPDWRFSRGNSAAVKMFGCADEAEFVEKTPVQLSAEFQPDGRPSEEKAPEMIEAALKQGSHQFEWVHLRGDGEPFPAEVLLNRIDIGGQEQLQATVRDVTQEKEMARAKVRAEQQEQYAAFQSGVAEMSASVMHNIGNVLTGINGNIRSCNNKLDDMERVRGGMEMLRKRLDEGGLDETQLSNGLEVINRTMELICHGEKKMGEGADAFWDGLRGQIQKLAHSVVHIGEIINAYRNVSRPEIRPSRFMLKQAVEDALQLIQDKCNRYQIELQVEVPTEVDLNIPRNPVIQMLLNLLKNSVEAVQERRNHQADLQGWIKVVVDQVDAEQVVMQVSDNGVGIDPKYQPEIFSHGHTTKEFGSGFGLHSVAVFVQSIGGSIRVESGGKDQGCAMEVVLPRVDQRLQLDESGGRDGE